MATKENRKINMAVSPETVLTDKITLLVLGAYKELQKVFSHLIEVNGIG